LRDCDEADLGLYRADSSGFELSPSSHNTLILFTPSCDRLEDAGLALVRPDAAGSCPALPAFSAYISHAGGTIPSLVGAG